MSETDDIVVEARDGVGRFLLNRPKALNALTLDMVRAMQARLDAWATDETVRAVVVRGAGGRAFCAGGDIRRLYDQGRASDHPGFAEFFGEEFVLNRTIFRYAKPYVALMNGMTMGGGVGVSVHGSHRVATEATAFAMPETGIGYFPDVGGSYFLPRCPGEIGMYMALTGARLKAADALYAGVATHYVPGERLDALCAALGDHSVDAALADFADDPGPPPLAEHRDTIDRCFAGKTVEAIVEALENEGTDWAGAALARIARMSPTSLKVTHRALRNGAELDFEACMTMEFRLAMHFMAGHDFFEGVRALVIDKDNAPAWSPARLKEVSEDAVNAYFAPANDPDLTFDSMRNNTP